MSKRDYENIAQTIRHMTVSPEMKTIIARDFAQMLKGENARFNIDRFMDAATQPLKGE